MSPRATLASTLGLDLNELSEYRYQNYASPAVYAIGDKYFAVGQKQPRHAVGGPWRKHRDQFFAERNNTIVWVADAA